MRLRADFLFDQKRYDEIEFWDNHNKLYKWEGGDNHSGFDIFLLNTFAWCGSASLEKQLNQVADKNNLKPGDVFIRGGFPGHAMIVADIAINDKGKKIFLLAQSYMPAQDIHIVRNPNDEKISPWYEVNESAEIITPEWTFSWKELKEW